MIDKVGPNVPRSSATTANVVHFILAATGVIRRKRQKGEKRQVSALSSTISTGRVHAHTHTLVGSRTAHAILTHTIHPGQWRVPAGGQPIYRYRSFITCTPRDVSSPVALVTIERKDWRMRGKGAR